MDLPNGHRLHIPLDLGFDWEKKAVIDPNLDLFDIDTSPKYPVGTKLQTPFNTFRYVEFGGTTAAGDVVQAEAPDAAHDDLDASDGDVAAGSTEITLADSLTIVENEYVGGLLVTEADTGAGYAYPILKNTAVSGATGAVITIQYGLAVAIDSTTDVKLVKSKYKEVIQMPTTVTGALAGVSLAIGADGSYGWVATRGPWAVLTDGTVVIGQHVRASDGTAGAVEPLDRDGTAEDEPEIGRVVDVGPTTEYSIVDLSLDN